MSNQVVRKVGMVRKALVGLVALGLVGVGVVVHEPVENGVDSVVGAVEALVADAGLTQQSATFFAFDLARNFNSSFTEAGGFQKTFAAARMTHFNPAFEFATAGTSFDFTMHFAGMFHDTFSFADFATT